MNPPRTVTRRQGRGSIKTPKVLSPQEKRKSSGAAGVTIFLISLGTRRQRSPTYQSDVYERAFAYRQSRDRSIFIG